jgi:hypothetical protein
MSTPTRAAGVAGAAVLALAAAVVLAVPAGAATGGRVSGQQPETMSTAALLLIVLGIPLLVAALVWLLVSAPGWTRDGRASDTDAWTGDPVVVGGTSGAAALPSAHTADSDTSTGSGTTGGTSAGW